MGYSGDLAGGNGSLVKCLIVEGLATFIFSYVYLQQFAGKWYNWSWDFGDSAFRLISVVTVLSWCAFGLSGAHLNPCVTVALMVKSKMEVKKGLFYLAVQAGATFIASVVLYVNTPLSDYKDTRQIWWNHVMPRSLLGDRNYLVLPYELIATFVFVLIFFSANVGKGGDKVASGFIIGLGYIFCTSMISAYTKATLNPYFYILPRLLCMQLSDALYYLIGPLVGAVLAAFAYEPLLGDSISDDETPNTDLN